jgi:hypothetical protein
MGRKARLAPRLLPGTRCVLAALAAAAPAPLGTALLGGARRKDTVRRAVLAVAVVALAWPGTSWAHKGSPHYRSSVRSIDPPVAGLDVKVLNYDDRLSLVNKTGGTVAVRGYGGEPYIRIGSDGSVAVNERSPSYYLNLERFGDAPVPREASENAPPKWKLVDKTGRFEWHDHRIHYMSKSLPNQVTDKGKRTKIFDWRIPVDARGRRVQVKGDLYWVPTAGGLPRGALIALAVVVVAAIFFVEVVRRRRRAAGRPGGASQAWG